MNNSLDEIEILKKEWITKDTQSFSVECNKYKKLYSLKIIDEDVSFEANHSIKKIFQQKSIKMWFLIQNQHAIHIVMKFFCTISIAQKNRTVTNNDGKLVTNKNETMQTTRKFGLVLRPSQTL